MSQDGSRRTENTQGEQGRQDQGETGPLQPKTRASDGGPTRAETACSRASAKEVILAEIAAWRRRHSQSDPGAAAELRELKAALRRLEGRS